MENIILYAVFCLKYDFFSKVIVNSIKIVYNYIVYSELDLRRVFNGWKTQSKHKSNYQHFCKSAEISLQNFKMTDVTHLKSQNLREHTSAQLKRKLYRGRPRIKETRQ